MFVVVMMVSTAAFSVMMMVLMLLHKLLLERVYLLHCLKNILAINIIPWCCDDGCLIVLLADHLDTGVKFVIGYLLGTT